MSIENLYEFPEFKENRKIQMNWYNIVDNTQLKVINDRLEYEGKVQSIKMFQDCADRKKKNQTAGQKNEKNSNPRG